MAGREQHTAEQHERDNRDQNRVAGGPAEVAEAGVDRQGGEREHRQDDPPGEAFEHHRGERARRLSVRSPTAG